MGFNGVFVPGAGIEPARVLPHWFLRPTRLPIPPSGLVGCRKGLQRYDFLPKPTKNHGDLHASQHAMLTPCIHAVYPVNNLCLHQRNEYCILAVHIHPLPLWQQRSKYSPGQRHCT